jgi:hypothetical protein
LTEPPTDNTGWTLTTIRDGGSPMNNTVVGAGVFITLLLVLVLLILQLT